MNLFVEGDNIILSSLLILSPILNQKSIKQYPFCSSFISDSRSSCVNITEVMFFLELQQTPQLQNAPLLSPPWYTSPLAKIILPSSSRNPSWKLPKKHYESEYVTPKPEGWLCWSKQPMYLIEGRTSTHLIFLKSKAQFLSTTMNSNSWASSSCCTKAGSLYLPPFSTLMISRNSPSCVSLEATHSPSEPSKTTLEPSILSSKYRLAIISLLLYWASTQPLSLSSMKCALTIAPKGVNINDLPLRRSFSQCPTTMQPFFRNAIPSPCLQAPCH